jgi:acyl carrier protein
MDNSFNIKKIDHIGIKNKIKVFIKDNFLVGARLNTFNENDSFMKKGIIDSTGVLELVSFIEVAFKIKVEDEELIPSNLDSLNKLSTYIAKKITNAG